MNKYKRILDYLALTLVIILCIVVVIEINDNNVAYDKIEELQKEVDKQTQNASDYHTDMLIIQSWIRDNFESGKPSTAEADTLLLKIDDLCQEQVDAHSEIQPE